MGPYFFGDIGLWVAPYWK